MGVSFLDDIQGLFEGLSLSDQSSPSQDEGCVDALTETGDMEFLDALIGYELQTDIPLGASPLASFRSGSRDISVTDFVGLTW